MLLDWSAVAPPFVVALVCVLLPGGLVATLLRVRGTAAIAIAGPISVAIIGVTGVLADLVGAPFGAGAVAVCTALAAAAAFVLRRFTPLVRRATDRWARPSLALVGGLVVGSGVIGLTALAWLPSLPIDQSYDGVFHANAIASILDGGSASSFRLYAITHPSDGVEFYPAGWHSLAALSAQLTGAPVPFASIATWWAVASAVWLPGIAWLSELLVRGPRMLVLPAAAVAGSAFTIFPALLLDWGVIYPTFLAYSLLPAGVALTVAAFGATRSEAAPRIPLAWAALIVWFAGACFAHPRSLPTGLVVLAPFLVWRVARWVAPRLRDPARRRRWLTWLAAGATALVLAGVGAVVFAFRYFDVANRPISDRLNGGPALATMTPGEAVWSVLAQSTPTSTWALPASLVLAALVLSGVVLAIVRPSLRWVAVAYALVALLFCLAASSDSDIAKLATALWYKDKFRLITALPLLGVPLVALALVGLRGLIVRLTRRRLPRIARNVLAALVAGALLVLTVESPALAAMRGTLAASFDVGDEKDGRLIDRDDVALLTRLPDLVPEGELVVGNPWNGSVLTWSVGRREALFPHLVGMWDPDRLLVAAGLSQAAENPIVCDALERLGVGYAYYSEGLLWDGDPQAQAFPGVDAAHGDPRVMELVAREGDAELYRITACG
ncbi:hypothetical protein H4J02_11375 [Protaetiibacter sp. SSC-01]|uniref:DUF6541 family protein n=1 Tax=Protaetiibacter sp. SSC-01 TaxID=2759943 RepID=UPI00165694C6|nr:DUF6541 family protein [Protaetiibacter sp. SSC-01]QNO37053.1 hypothetical protein H4J02_11375 [Protaetiibacter sp. SSC-01]